MTDYAASHEGIELDIIDISGQNKAVNHPHRTAPRTIPRIDKVDPVCFVKHIYKKIRENDSFLSFSTQIQDLNKILAMKYSSANDIAVVILRDMALTTKLLKLVNSSFYGHLSTNGVATVSEAMIILGTEEIKLAAASLKIYEFMKGIANVTILKEKTVKALQRSIIARQIAVNEGIKDAEAIQISAMLYDFGQYLVALFSPDIFINVEILVDESDMTRDEASKSIIGIAYNELGRFIASKWNLPASIIHAMRPARTLDIDKNELSLDDLQQNICAFTNDLCNIEFSMDNDQIGKKIIEISERYANCLEITPTQSVELLNISREKIKTHTKILNAKSYYKKV
jgi:HD-like signal output (HDOD) protein